MTWHRGKRHFVCRHSASRSTHRMPQHRIFVGIRSSRSFGLSSSAAVQHRFVAAPSSRQARSAPKTLVFALRHQKSTRLQIDNSFSTSTTPQVLQRSSSSANRQTRRVPSGHQKGPFLRFGATNVGDNSPREAPSLFVHNRSREFSG